MEVAQILSANLFLSGTREVERKYSPLLPNFIRGTWGPTGLCQSSVQPTSTLLFGVPFPLFSRQWHRAQQRCPSTGFHGCIYHRLGLPMRFRANSFMKECRGVQRISLAIVF